MYLPCSAGVAQSITYSPWWVRQGFHHHLQVSWSDASDAVHRSDRALFFAGQRITFPSTSRYVSVMHLIWGLVLSHWRWSEDWPPFFLYLARHIPEVLVVLVYCRWYVFRNKPLGIGPVPTARFLPSAQCPMPSAQCQFILLSRQNLKCIQLEYSQELRNLASKSSKF